MKSECKHNVNNPRQAARRHGQPLKKRCFGSWRSLLIYFVFIQYIFFMSNSTVVFVSFSSLFNYYYCHSNSVKCVSISNDELNSGLFEKGLAFPWLGIKVALHKTFFACLFVLFCFVFYYGGYLKLTTYFSLIPPTPTFFLLTLIFTRRSCLPLAYHISSSYRP